VARAIDIACRSQNDCLNDSISRYLVQARDEFAHEAKRERVAACGAIEGDDRCCVFELEGQVLIGHRCASLLSEASLRRAEATRMLENSNVSFPSDERIRVLITGGTFDKEYDEINGRLFFKDSHLPEMLRLGRCKLDLEIRTLMMIDSLEMTDADRNLIVEQCERTPESRIVITHGTDTMEATAKLLAEKSRGKTIVLTGAMVPYKFGSSDGLFNLGSALAFVQTLPHGVYVAMNGRYFAAERVRKNRQSGYFEEEA
jgi:L-asparaginase